MFVRRPAPLLALGLALGIGACTVSSEVLPRGGGPSSGGASGQGSGGDVGAPGSGGAAGTAGETGSGGAVGSGSGGTSGMDGTGGASGTGGGAGGGAAPPRMHYPFCPTSIDVYGGPNVLLAGCGGPSQAFIPEQGYFYPGASDYDASLAGRLQARLSGEPNLAPRFGSTWQVRSCGAQRGTLMQLAPPLPVDTCGLDTPPSMGTSSTMCSASPAPLLIISAQDLDDRCHGGGPDSGQADDLDTYASHLAARLDAFLVARAPRFALIGPQTEWIPAIVPVPSSGANPPPPGTFDETLCFAQRSDWNSEGVRVWAARSSQLANVRIVPDQHDVFKTHHPCCRALGFACDTRWYSTSMTMPLSLNCDGAQAMVDIWYDALERFLLENDFDCP